MPSPLLQRRPPPSGRGPPPSPGQSLVQALRGATSGCSVTMDPLTATELSGFGLDADMSDTLVVATSQSGTTTDTNRTVDLAAARGALVIAIVNRRQSDLVDKSDGVLFTSDGRDVEMSVASTKAFYSQVAACFLLAFAIAARAGRRQPPTPRVPSRTARGAARAARRDGRADRPAGSIGEDRAAQRA